MEPTSNAPTIGGDFSIEEIERAHIEAVVKSKPTLGEAAKILNIDPATLYRKRKRWQSQAPAASA